MAAPRSAQGHRIVMGRDSPSVRREMHVGIVAEDACVTEGRDVEWAIAMRSQASRRAS